MKQLTRVSSAIVGLVRQHSVVLAVICLCFVHLSCRTAAPPRSTEPAATVLGDQRLHPTLTTVPAAGTPEATKRREIVAAVHRIVRDRYHDPRLRGANWDEVRRRYEPLAVAAPNDTAFYRVLNDMLGELGPSHLLVTGPSGDEQFAVSEGAGGAAPAGGANTAAATVAPAAPSVLAPGTGPFPGGSSAALPAGGGPVFVSDIGDPGVKVRLIEGRPTVTEVRAGSSADRHRIAPGFIVTSIADRPLPGLVRRRALRPVEERFAVHRRATHLLQGPIGTKIGLEFLDNDDKPGQVILEREAPAGAALRVGQLPPVYPRAEIKQVSGAGVLAFNIFLPDPVLAELRDGLDRFRAREPKGVILDLRGNPGGLAAMALPVASEFVTTPMDLGTLQFRTFSQRLTATPSPDRPAYKGPLIILTDEGTASASEILAIGLQEAGRARVVGGDATLGAVFPSTIEALPHGALMQVPVADFKTPKGVSLEGKGIRPDRNVVETRAAVRAGRDLGIEAALAELQAFDRATGSSPVEKTPDAR